MTEPILLQTLKGKATSRPPFWFMRQAGRVLPNYLKIKENYTFWQMMQDPKVAAEVTLMPIYDLGVDAAISVQRYSCNTLCTGHGTRLYRSGPVFEKPLFERSNPLEGLNPDPSKLNYIYEVIDEIIKTRPAGIFRSSDFVRSPAYSFTFYATGTGAKR
jgi:uroporphyrinogen decarboxylase